MTDAPETPPTHGKFETLSPRQKEVATLLAIGRTCREIAEALGAGAAGTPVSVKTIDTHRAMILKKLKLRNNVELCLLLVREGKVRP